MTYTVVWKPEAQQRLAYLWTKGHDRQDVTDAANFIDSALRRNPSEQGESRDEDRRILVVQPLIVLFRVYEDDCLVRVLDVWRAQSDPMV